MFIDRIKLVSKDRASHIAGVDSSVIDKAVRMWSETNGRRGLEFVALPGSSRIKIRLCAIDDWLTRLEEDSRYA